METSSYLLPQKYFRASTHAYLKHLQPFSKVRAWPYCLLLHCTQKFVSRHLKAFNINSNSLELSGDQQIRKPLVQLLIIEKKEQNDTAYKYRVQYQSGNSLHKSVLLDTLFSSGAHLNHLNHYIFIYIYISIKAHAGHITQ